ncbi:hypothetical protein CQ052_03890 [Ochrobactrum sp. MYb15]|nr:hypothetical protein CQZ90_05000 [Ochrobactrum sp. MYb19]PRA62815.1 hypothetical protein CQ053_18385 [Ochrobactrum sp. MYb18]PRA76532.1 hypothetical protein CQ049_03890 [Brucella thiophenivorans]PRA93837.1 hypothetical protein CQ051_05000 [Ochrobactrum sp. MYb14]PRA98539.1 hypothetical protein CQ052_03890 [Ochrobactrum sp. MYb15]
MNQINSASARLELLAPGKTNRDWSNFSKCLSPGRDPDLWAETFDAFLLGRLKSRYLTPIGMIRDNGTWEGEGFTIASIQCALIEFLAATRAGKNYRHKNPQGPYEYNVSRDLFVDFLFRTEPFDKLFSKIDAENFYSNVRCALLHEARTKAGWIIWSSGAVAVDCKKKIVYRDSFQTLIEQYIDDYGRALATSIPLQEAFLRKFHDLAA